MEKYIAHASIDENGKISGGNAGDQTGKEVCIRTWYNKNYGHVLRIEDEMVRIQFANNMIDIAKNNKIGYDQNQRNTLLTQAKNVGFDFSKITVSCECDCSSAITIALLAAIFVILGKEAYEKAYAILVISGNCATTRTLRNRMKKLDMISVSVYTSNSYTRKTTNAIYGDIYLKEGSHVVAYIETGEKKEVNRSVENGNEINNKNISILEWQKAAIADGFSFPKYGADGEWGNECETIAKKAIVKKRLTYKYPNLTKIVQKAVGMADAEIDGKCGKKTEDAIITYQIVNKLYADGHVGISTWKSLLGIT